MMKQCPCSFCKALIRKSFSPGSDLPRRADLTALREDAGSCCCLALIHYLSCRCDNVPAFLDEMRDHISAVYSRPSDG